MPEDAPVIMIVLPSRRFAIAVAIVRFATWQLNRVWDTAAQLSNGSCKSLEERKNCFLFGVKNIRNYGQFKRGINGVFKLQLLEDVIRAAAQRHLRSY